MSVWPIASEDDKLVFMSETRKVIIIGSGPAGHTAGIYAASPVVS